MKKKRRQVSAAELSVVHVKADKRPEPPLCLNERAEEEWVRVVAAMPSDWFGSETLALLQSMCEHISEGHHIQQMIEQVRGTVMDSDESYARYRCLLRDKEIQTSAAVRIATKLRLSHQSSYNA